MEVFAGFLYVVYVIIWLAVFFLGIVLLFKVWSMCDDVRRIKNKIIKNDDIETTIEFLLRIGEKEKAKEALLDRILTNETIFNRESEMSQDEKIENIFRIYEEEFKKLGYSIPEKNKE